MVYIERKPHPALAPYIRCLWYTRDPDAEHGLERVLPGGHMQLIMSLARDYLTDCSGGADSPMRHSPPALLAGMQSGYQLIDRYDMAELIGVIFRPGGTSAFFPGDTGVFTDLETSLESVWGRSAVDLRDRMRESTAIRDKFAILGAEFLRRLAMAGDSRRPAAVAHALAALHNSGPAVTIREISGQTGLSPRRLSDVFRQQVGVSPKLYQRLLRFQRAVRQMHRAEDVRWMELALECGYYDQSHFVNDFREFSGINPTAYSMTDRIWSNHLPVS